MHEYPITEQIVKIASTCTFLVCKYKNMLNKYRKNPITLTQIR